MTTCFKMDKKSLSERDICTKFITPALVQVGWDDKNQIREEVSFTDGRIKVVGSKVERAPGKRADYILYYKPNLPIAVIEAKDNTHAVGAGMQQALDYAENLKLPFVFSSNGDAFIFHDRTGNSEQVEQELSMNEFPSPEELWQRYKAWKGINEEQEQAITQSYHTQKTPRYYQEIAINKTVEAIAKDQDRILLVMATGTGKTFVASQIIYKLWKSKQKKRILFLADRNILVDQAKTNDFKIFGDALTKVTNRKADKAYEIYMALYQGISGNEEWKNIYKQFSPEFFDLIVVDECHRGSAKADSAWREILEYFSNATQIGLTATPKETKEVSNIDYFGEPIYTYSLKQGIEDGFLAPYKVVKISLDRDLEGWRPTRGQKDNYGYEIEDRVYNGKDYDKSLVIDDRTNIVAGKITEFLKNSGNRYAKTIVFCTDIDHAERMRGALVNHNADMMQENSKYVMKLTGDDEYGKREVDNFIDPSVKYPVIATTSKLLTTGVDAQTCKLIVLDTNINSMPEFKQIIGRGTRIRSDYGKYYFTIMDFRNVTNLFADPDFDGEPVQVFQPKQNEQIHIKEAKEEKEYDESQEIGIKEGREKPRKYYVKGVPVNVINERVQYVDNEGKLIMESLKDYTKKTIQQEFNSLNDFIRKWNGAEKKSALIKELEEQGILIRELKEEVGKDYDDFDLICHVAFDQPPLTRRERAKKVKNSDYFQKYGEKARKIIDALIDKYADQGIEDIETTDVLKVNPINKMGTTMELINEFGGKEGFMKAIKELEEKLYGEA